MSIPGSAPSHSSHPSIIASPGRFMTYSAKIWGVEPDRGDRYFVVLPNNTVQFVQLSDGGIANDPNTIVGAAIQVQVDERGAVVQLQSQITHTWMHCDQVF